MSGGPVGEAVGPPGHQPSGGTVLKLLTAALVAAATATVVGAFLLTTLDCCPHPEAG